MQPDNTWTRNMAERHHGVEALSLEEELAAVGPLQATYLGGTYLPYLC